MRGSQAASTGTRGNVETAPFDRSRHLSERDPGESGWPATARPAPLSAAHDYDPEPCRAPPAAGQHTRRRRGEWAEGSPPRPGHKRDTGCRSCSEPIETIGVPKGALTSTINQCCSNAVGHFFFCCFSRVFRMSVPLGKKLERSNAPASCEARSMKSDACASPDPTGAQRRGPSLPTARRV